MTNEHFLDLTGGVVIRSPLIWECTRFCLAPDAPVGVAGALLVAGVELGLRFGLEQALGVDLFEDHPDLSPHRLGARRHRQPRRGPRRDQRRPLGDLRGAPRRDLAPLRHPPLGHRALVRRELPAALRRGPRRRLTRWPRLHAAARQGQRQAGGAWTIRPIRRGRATASRRSLRAAGVDLAEAALLPDGGGAQPTLAVIGKAGSGKTMLLADLVKGLVAAGVETVSADYESRKTRTKRTLAVLAPTNKAASVLREPRRAGDDDPPHPLHPALRAGVRGDRRVADRQGRPAEGRGADRGGARPGARLLPAAPVDPGRARQRRACAARTSSRAGSAATSRSTSG